MQSLCTLLLLYYTMLLHSIDCAVRSRLTSSYDAAAGDTAVELTSSCTAVAGATAAAVHCSMTAAEVTTLQRRNARLEADNATARRTVALLKHQLDKVRFSN
jgi:hypothetical protein